LDVVTGMKSNSILFPLIHIDYCGLRWLKRKIGLKRGEKSLEEKA